MTNDIDKIASKHLGRAGDGSVVNPYKTPESIDNTLLVAIPRELNRTQYKIDSNDLPFKGFDTWHCYEISFLNVNGYPINCVGKISYPCDSEFIVESKSIKLYLNSFNMQRFPLSSIDDCMNAAKEKIQTDLSDALRTDVRVGLIRETYDLFDSFETAPIESVFFKNLESQIGEDVLEKMVFDEYSESPSILQTTKENYKELSIWTSALRSNCRVTNQPDWGDVFIYISGMEGLPTRESLLKYIVSMRKENHFHEEICECIYKRLLDRFNPTNLLVCCLYTRRGGIDINPVRYSNEKIFKSVIEGLYDVNTPSIKTLRQ